MVDTDKLLDAATDLAIIGGTVMVAGKVMHTFGMKKKKKKKIKIKW
jgi:hypothetical protein